jgi:hypothetical protein
MSKAAETKKSQLCTYQTLAARKQNQSQHPLHSASEAI